MNDTERATSVFLSSAPADNAFVTRLARAIEAAGATAWRADRLADHPPDSWNEFVRTHASFVVVLSDAALASDAIQAQCALAYALAADDPSRRFVTVMVPQYGPDSPTATMTHTLRKLGLIPPHRSPSPRSLPATPPASAVSAPSPSSAPSSSQPLPIRPLLAQSHGLSDALFPAESLERVCQLYEEVTQLAPENAAAWNALGDICALLEQNTDALAAYQHALRLEPMSAELCCTMGAMYTRLGRFEDALASYEQALRLDADSPRALEQRGRALVAVGRVDEALAAYDDALAAQPASAWLWHARGNAFYELRRMTDALDSYERALAIWPHFTCVWKDKAEVLRALGRVDEARQAERRLAQ